VSPNEALGAFTENLDRRFRDFETSFRTKLIEAMKHEDKLLHQFVEKNRLSKWVQTTFEAARAELDSTLDTATKNASVVSTDKVMAGSIFDTDMSMDTSPGGRF
jgi:nuclear pore complex protein Nup133